MRNLLMTTLLCVGMTPALADDAALIIGNERYKTLGKVEQATLPPGQIREMDRAGFKIFSGSNLKGDDARKMLGRFLDETSDAERLVVSLSGRFATIGDQTWFLASDKRDPNLLDIGTDTISIETVLLFMDQAAGQSILILSPPRFDKAEYDEHLRAGIGTLDIPEGVTVIQAQSGAAAKLLRDTIAKSGGDVMREVRRNSQLTAQGYQPRSLVMTGANRSEPEPAPIPLPTRRERDAWQTAQDIDTAQSYSTYLDRYPRGFFADEARKMLDDIRADPTRAARLTEEALNLPRDARRAIQRDLNVLDYSTGGIDGIFGPSTRRAIINWQQERGYPQTSYLTADQITRLDAQAARRKAELEAEAERERQLRERRDRAFWEETGAIGDEAGYRAYLDRFPDGLFADTATAALDRIEHRKRDRLRAAERDVWDAARSQNTVAAYRSYLDKYPSGEFSEAAKSQIQTLERNAQNSNAQKQAAEEERKLGLNAITIRLVEVQLQALGLNPGSVDGRIDENTRRAIRQYQRDRKLERTGYLNRITLSRMLTDALR